MILDLGVITVLKHT